MAPQLGSLDPPVLGLRHGLQAETVGLGLESPGLVKVIVHTRPNSKCEVRAY